MCSSGTDKRKNGLIVIDAVVGGQRAQEMAWGDRMGLSVSRLEFTPMPSMAQIAPVNVNTVPIQTQAPQARDDASLQHC